MINEYVVKNIVKNHADDIWFRIENDDIIDKESGKRICSLKTYTQHLREKLHCDFETIYSCHGLLQSTLRCKQCGCIIFTYEDERWEPDLCCPVCSDYKTGFEYWTPEEIKADEKKQNTIKFLEDCEREQIEAEERRQKRGGKSDWQIGKKSIRIGKYKVRFELECDNLFKTKLRGLRLAVSIWKKEEVGFAFQRNFTIPLSLSHAIVRYKIWKKYRKKGDIQNGRDC